jgi:hypothetical protein
MLRPSILVTLLLTGLIAAHAADPHPSLPPPVIPDCLGVNIHFTDPKPGELEMLAAAGFKWVRMDFGWGGTERKKGEYDFSAYDRLVAALDRFKIHAVFILDYGNPLYADPGDSQPFTSRANTLEFREAFGKWAVAAVQHFKGRGYLWEMWNEPNGGFWKSSDKTGDYIALAKSTGEALRQAGLFGPKGEAYIGPATSTIDLPYLEACFKAGLLDYWDAVSVHPYRQGPPESVEEEYRGVRMLIRKYGPKDKVIPIISGEWGYSSAWTGMGKDEAARIEQQGKYLPREFLTNIANDVALSIWYDWHEDGTDPKEGEHHFGIVGNAYHPGRDPVYDPKPAYTAMKTLNAQLGGFRFNKEVVPETIPSIGQDPDRDKVRLEVMTKGREIKLAAWHYIYRYPLVFLIPAASENFATIDSLGQPGPKMSVTEDGFSLTPNDSPIYLTPRKEDDVLKVIAANERLPLEYVGHSPCRFGEEIGLFNPLKRKISGQIGFTAWEVAPGQKDAGALGQVIDLLQRPSKPIREAIDWHLEVGKGGGFFTERTYLVCTNPLEVEVSPLGEGKLSCRVRNPTGEAFKGSILLIKNHNAGEPLLEKDLSLAAGEKEKTVLLEFSDDRNDRTLDTTLEVRIQEPELRMKISGGDFTESPYTVLNETVGVPRPMEPEIFEKSKLVADGDAKVASQQQAESAHPDSSPPPASGPCLRLRYQFSAGWKFLRLATSAPVRMRFDDWPADDDKSFPKGFGLWIYGDGKGCAARLRFTDSSGQASNRTVPESIGKAGATSDSLCSPQATSPSPTGAGPTTARSIKWDSIFLLDNPSRQPVDGEIYLSAPTLLY